MDDKTINVNGHKLIFRHYKEPLRKVEGGFGFYGAILQTTDCHQILCHECGELFEDLSFHVFSKHKMRTEEYRTKYKIAKETALVSDSKRLKLRERTVEWYNKLTDEQKSEYKRIAIERRKQVGRTPQPKIALETRNKRGTCPDQLIDKIHKVYKQLGEVPSKDDFITACGTQKYVHNIYEVFGSWSTALKMAGLKEKPGYGQSNRTQRYETDELLEYLVIFTQENNRYPTATDFRRGLLPSYNVYTRRFGSISRARELANLDEYIEENHEQKVI